MSVMLALLMNILLSTGYAQDVQMIVEPEHPIEGENFMLIFKIKVDGNVEPQISFNPGSAEVLGKSNQGLGITTRLVNGRFTTTREISVAYEMIANRPGKIQIRDIKIDLAGSISHPKDMVIDITSKEEKNEAKEVFVIAIPSKNSVYVGEGVNVDYYLYARVPVVSHEIADFPKLNNFTKRFQNANEQVERVEYHGYVYSRSKKYAARLYAEKPGKAVIDPMRLKVQYSSADSNSPYSGFGFAIRQYKTASMASRPVEIEVKALPATDVPKSFTGLVGKNDFKLTATGKKYLANEAIEVQLEVTGDGALESLDAPSIYEHSNLEKFDTKADFEEIDRSHARKKFEYTYLGRGPVDIKAQKIELSVFNPSSGHYETTTIDVPDLTVEGVAATSESNKPIEKVTSDGEKDKEAIIPPSVNVPIAKQSSDLLAPIFDPISPTIFSFGRLNILLLITLLLGMVSILKNIAPRNSKLEEVRKLHREIEGVGVNYPTLFRFMCEAEIFPKGNGMQVMDMDRAIDKMALSSSSKTYFKNLIENLEKSNYHGQNGGKLAIDKKHWKELYKVVSKNIDTGNEKVTT